MRRNNLLRHLRMYDCDLLREGGRHSIWINRISGKISAIPRHAEIKEVIVRKICRDLDIPIP